MKLCWVLKDKVFFLTLGIIEKGSSCFIGALVYGAAGKHEALKGSCKMELVFSAVLNRQTQQFTDYFLKKWFLKVEGQPKTNFKSTGSDIVRLIYLTL